MPHDEPPPSAPVKVAVDRGILLAERRTQLSFNRTHQSLDRTLMAQIRTSLALITFGFTIYQAFRGLEHSPLTTIGGGEARIFGASLVLAGMVMLSLGLVHHFRSLKHLRAQRVRLLHEGVSRPEDLAPLPFTLVTAALLWLIGLFAILAIVFGP